MVFSSLLLHCITLLYIAVRWLHYISSHYTMICHSIVQYSIIMYSIFCYIIVYVCETKMRATQCQKHGLHPKNPCGTVAGARWLDADSKSRSPTVLWQEHDCA